MRVVLSADALERLEAQLEYLVDAGAEGAAERLRIRLTDFLFEHLANFPRTGRPLQDSDLWEMRVPRTRLVVWYRIGREHIEVATVWHTSQDRRTAES